MGAPDDPIDIAIGFGSLEGALDMIEIGVELEKGSLGLAGLETLAGPAKVIGQVIFMAEQGRDAQAVLLAEGGESMIFGQESEVDGLALGMAASFTIHGFHL
jgi:hypothetical protein